MIQRQKMDFKLGAGIYTVPDVAFLLQLPKAKVRRWLNDFWDGRLSKKYVQDYSKGEGRQKATNFYVLIEFYVFYQLREANVGYKAIFTAHEEMSKQLKTPFPFAHAKVLTDGKSILYALQDGTTINADRSKQITIAKLIESFCRKIEFAEDDLAMRYWPLGQKKHIVVDPHHQFGQPVISNTNVLAETIYGYHIAGESDEFLAKLFDIPVRDVENAIELFRTKAA